MMRIKYEELLKLHVPEKNNLLGVFIFRSGLGNPTSGKVLREASAALQSVFPPISLMKFMQQGRIDKRAQIRELAHIVAGIRLFNWVCSKLI